MRRRGRSNVKEGLLNSPVNQRKPPFQPLGGVFGILAPDPVRLLQKGRILFQIEHTIPLDNIQDLSFKEGPLLRYFELSILKIETAGQSGQGGSDMALYGIQNGDEFRSRVLAQRDRLTERPSDRSAPEDSVATGRSDRVEELLIEIRDAIRELDA